MDTNSLPSFFRLSQPSVLDSIGGLSATEESTPSKSTVADTDTFGTFDAYNADSALPDFFTAAANATTDFSDYLSILGDSSNLGSGLMNMGGDDSKLNLFASSSSIPLPTGAIALNSIPAAGLHGNTSSSIPLPSGASILSAPPQKGLTFSAAQTSVATSYASATGSEQVSSLAPSIPQGKKVDWKGALGNPAADTPSTSEPLSTSHANPPPSGPPLHPFAYGPPPFMAGPHFPPHMPPGMMLPPGVVMGPRGPMMMGPNGPVPLHPSMMPPLMHPHPGMMMPGPPMGPMGFPPLPPEMFFNKSPAEVESMLKSMFPNGPPHPAMMGPRGPGAPPGPGHQGQDRGGRAAPREERPAKKLNDADFPVLGTEAPVTAKPEVKVADKPKGKPVWQLLARAVDVKADVDASVAEGEAVPPQSNSASTERSSSASGGRGRGRGRGAESRGGGGGRGSSARGGRGGTGVSSSGAATTYKPNLSHPKMNPGSRPGRVAGRGGRGPFAGRGRGASSDLIQVGPRGAYGLGSQSGAFRATGAREVLKLGSEMMSAADIRHVCERVLQPLRFPDPYSDDYYYIQTSVKRNSTAREIAIKDSLPLPQPIQIPQPMWRDVKERIRGQIDEFKQKIYDRSRDWETREQVLGHLVRSQIDRPKAQLSVPTLRDIRREEIKDLGGMDVMDAAGKESAAATSTSFETRLWTMRAAVQRGYEALTTAQELTQLLRSETAQDPFARSEILYDMDRALNLLSQSVGIRVPAFDPLSGPPAMQRPGETVVQLEGNLVAMLMQSAKGRKLLSRSMNMLPPDHRWALIPVILARILQSNPSEQSEEVNERYVFSH